uniref:Uncharacterized protein n=1 Tax=Strongyloides papillosus TaxID=174720 RepID=A0A0N5B2H2_STREA
MIILSRISLLLIALILEARISYADDYEDWPPGELKAAWYTVPIINLTEYKNRIKERHRQIDERVEQLIKDEPRKYKEIMAKIKANNGTGDGKKGDVAKPGTNPQVNITNPASTPQNPVLGVESNTPSVPKFQVHATTGASPSNPNTNQATPSNNSTEAPLPSTGTKTGDTSYNGSTNAPPSSTLNTNTAPPSTRNTNAPPSSTFNTNAPPSSTQSTNKVPSSTTTENNASATEQTGAETYH